MEKVLRVKEKSVLAFLEEKMLGYDKTMANVNCGVSYGQTLLKQEMFLKKDCGIKIGETVVIEFLDKTQILGKELLGTYTYMVEEYDDFTIKMILKDSSFIEKKWL